ncbi:MAG TPA: isocitrate lyase/PEP mutase family protein [Hyphomicrobiaceae bacterium]|nr:isocitrate lyase/PEP mutase family protein [Hyphomicrobiaceae bacterium]
MRASTELRSRLAAGRTLWSASAYDALSAKIIGDSGFDLVQTAGFAISASALGVPDVELYSVTENLNVVRACVEAAGIPLIADIDTGYGNAINVMRTVREFEKAGVAGVALEDQVSPKRCPGLTDVEILPFDEAVGKVRAAVAARRDPDLLIVARTDTQDDDEAIRRGRAFVEAGADMFQVIAKYRNGFAAMERIRREVGVPLKVHVTGKVTEWSRDQIEGIAGVAGFAHVALLSATAALRANLAALAKTKSALDLPIQPMDRSAFHDFIGYPEVHKLQEQFMPQRSAS